jgi:protein-disulfide isomerase-like protein with CxxC motif
VIEIVHFSDPGCPWAWSASPHLSVLHWRYGDQLRWRLVMIGLTEHGGVYERRGYTAEGMARGYRTFRRRGMPFSTLPRQHVHGTWPMCRAVVAARLTDPEREWSVFRALQFAQFTTTLDLETEEGIRPTLERVPGVDVDALIEAAGSPEVEAAFAQDRAEARTAEGTPTEAQGKAARTDGKVRYTAPSLIFEHEGRRLEAGGFQHIEAYDVVLANLAPRLERTPPPQDPLEALEAFEYGLTTYEVAAVMNQDKNEPDPESAELALIEHVAEGRVIRESLGDGALWRVPSAQSGPGRTASGQAAAAPR